MGFRDYYPIRKSVRAGYYDKDSQESAEKIARLIEQQTPYETDVYERYFMGKHDCWVVEIALPEHHTMDLTPRKWVVIHDDTERTIEVLSSKEFRARYRSAD